MTNAHTVNVALAFLTSTHNAEQDAINEIARLKEENAKLAAAHAGKPKAPKAAKRSRPIHDQGNPRPVNTIHGMSLPDKGTLDAAGFTAAMVNAGKRTVHMVCEVDAKGKKSYHVLPAATDTSHTVTRVEHDKVRDDQIKAIAAYIGYDNRRNFGEQEVAARMMAQRAMLNRPDCGPDREVQRKADLSAKGFVAGLPNAVGSKLEDLQARELVAVEEMLRHTKESEDVSRSASDRELSQALALVEEERLTSIRGFIASMTFEK